MTTMLERLIATEKDFKKQIIAGVPQHKIGQPENVADVILFLCSAQASYITGQYLAIDGGWVAQ